MLSGFGAIARLAEHAAIDADHAIAADYPIVAVDARRLGGRELRCDFHRIIELLLDGIFINVRLYGFEADARGIEHLPPDGAGRGKDQDQWNNLVEKPRMTASPPLGAVSTADFEGAAQRLFELSSTGTDSIPRL